MTPKPQPNPETVSSIVDIATSKCFDWAQSDGTGAIAETMAAVAAALTENAVALKHELMES